MRDQNAEQLLARVMGWQSDTVRNHVPSLTLLADYKYDHYQQFAPGRRFVESLALWLEQFDSADRQLAFEIVRDQLVFFSDAEFSHLVQMAYPDVITRERLRLVAEEQSLPPHRVRAIEQHARFQELRIKSLYLGLSDGARTNELRRASDGEISNEQIWHAYELGRDKANEMLAELRRALCNLYGTSRTGPDPKFNSIWLLDDFSGSGNSYIRYDGSTSTYKGKVAKIYERLDVGDLVDINYYEVFLLLYVATRQAIDHIEYWAERFTSEKGYKPLHVHVLCPIEREVALTSAPVAGLAGLFDNPKYYDHRVFDKHFAVGGTVDARYGFAGCALPVVLSHNTPNNSVYILWGPDFCQFVGLFPRVSRHREF